VLLCVTSEKRRSWLLMQKREASLPF